jgi:hypothetical protein
MTGNAAPTVNRSHAFVIGPPAGLTDSPEEGKIGPEARRAQQEGLPMKPGEAMILLLAAVGLGGVAATAFSPAVDASLLEGGEATESAGSPVQPANPLDRFTSGCSELIYGNLPRQSFSGDTTVLTMDLDIDAYTVTQANLEITRLMRRCGIILISTRERQEGGLTFIAEFSGGEALRLELKAPR